MESKVAVVSPTVVNNTPEPITISLEAKFHGILDATWDSKLIKFPTGGLLWGLHLFKKESVPSGGPGARVVSSLLCYGPIERPQSDWSLNFDHAFTIAFGASGCAGPIKEGSCFYRHHNTISNAEWGARKQCAPENWGTDDDVRLSCHLFIKETTGIDRLALKDASTQGAVDENSEDQLTPGQIGNQVMTTFAELLCEEKIEYTQEGYEAARKIGELMAYPQVLGIIRQYIRRAQSEGGSGAGGKQIRRQPRVVNLEGFDYIQNISYRRQRMHRCNEEDVVAIFQQLCQIAFQKINH